MSDVPRSLQSWVSTIHTVVLTADVFQLFIKTDMLTRNILGGWVVVGLGWVQLFIFLIRGDEIIYMHPSPKIQSIRGRRTQAMGKNKIKQSTSYVHALSSVRGEYCCLLGTLLDTAVHIIIILKQLVHFIYRFFYGRYKWKWHQHAYAPDTWYAHCTSCSQNWNRGDHIQTKRKNKMKQKWNKYN